MPVGRVLDVWASNIPEVASLGNVGSNAYIRLFDQDNRTGKAVALGVRDTAVSLFNMSTATSPAAMRFGVGTSNPNPAAMLDVAGLIVASNLVAQIDGSNLTSGTIVKERLAVSGASAGTYGTASNLLVATVDVYGRVTALSNLTPSLAGERITSGTLDAARLAVSGVVAGTYGLSNVIPSFSVDDKGRVTSVVTRNVQVDAAAVTSGVLPIARGGTGFGTWDAYRVIHGGVDGGLTTDPLFVYKLGALGIGTANPTGQLHVIGNAFVSGTISCSNLNFFSETNSFQTIEAVTTLSETIVASNMGTGPALYVVQGGPQPLADFVDFESGIAVRIANNGNTGFGTSNVSARVHIFTSNTANEPLLIEPTGKPLVVKNDGGVGIGTLAPAANQSLHVFGTSLFSSNIVASEDLSVTKNVYVTAGVGIGTSARRVPGMNYVDVAVSAVGQGIQVANSTDSNIGVRLVAGTGSGATPTVYNGALDVSQGLALVSRSDATVRHVFDVTTGNQVNAGSLGLGIPGTVPSARLDVHGVAKVSSNVDVGTFLNVPVGTAATPSIRVGSGDAGGPGLFGPSATSLGFATGSNERMRIGAGGSVGIGSVMYVEPTGTLHLQGSNPSTTVPSPILQLQNLTTTGGMTAIDFCTIQNSGISGTTTTPMARITGVTDAFNSTADLVFSHRNPNNPAALTERMRLTDAGVGIGTAVPQALLDVNGAIQSGVIYSTGYTWVADSSTRIQNPANGAISFTFNTGEQFRVTNTGTAGFFLGGAAATGFQVNALGLIGPGGSAGSATATTGGPFMRQGAWTTAGTTHTISGSLFTMGDNSAGTLHIQAALKTAGVGKAANAMVSFVKHSGGTLDVFVISLHKSATMTTFSVTGTAGSDIQVTTDAGCSVCWTSIGAY